MKKIIYTCDKCGIEGEDRYYFRSEKWHDVWVDDVKKLLCDGCMEKCRKILIEWMETK